MEKNAEIDNKAIGQRIREERNRFELSREEFAEILGLSDYYIGQLERGERQMSLPVLVKVANCLHLSLDYLIFGKANDGYIHDASYTRDISNPYHPHKDEEIEELLKKCSPKELVLIKKIVKTILPYTK